MNHTEPSPAAAQRLSALIRLLYRFDAGLGQRRSWLERAFKALQNRHQLALWIEGQADGVAMMQALAPSAERVTEIQVLIAGTCDQLDRLIELLPVDTPMYPGMGTPLKPTAPEQKADQPVAAIGIEAKLERILDRVAAIAAAVDRRERDARFRRMGSPPSYSEG